MVSVIYGPQEHHSVRDVAAYRRAHEQFIARRAATGARLAVHVDEAPRPARIDANSWIVDCDCGAGNATDPSWGIACCYGCGAVHTVIEFPAPATRELVEAALLERRRPFDRAWRPGESVADLAAENVAIGVAVPTRVADHVRELAELEAGRP
jgi:hypothetical protein